MTRKDIKRQVAERHGLTVEEIEAPGRRLAAQRARDEAMYLMRQVLRVTGQHRWSLPLIGGEFGRHHTATLRAIRRHEARLNQRPVSVEAFTYREAA